MPISTWYGQIVPSARSSDSRSASSIAFFAPGENGIASGDASPRERGELLDRTPHAGVGDAHRLEHQRRGRSGVPEQAEQEVLGADRVAAELARLLVCASTTTCRARGLKCSNGVRRRFCRGGAAASLGSRPSCPTSADCSRKIASAADRAAVALGLPRSRS